MMCYAMQCYAILNRFRYDNYNMYRRAVGIAAKFANAPADDCVFVQNATTGVNSVLTSLIPDLKTDDVLLTANTTYLLPHVRHHSSSSLPDCMRFLCHHSYNAVKLAMRRTAERAGGVYKEFDITFPCTNDTIIDALRAALHANPRVRLVVLDHITSATALVLPIKALVQLCHQRNVLAVVDGAQYAHDHIIVHHFEYIRSISWYDGMMA